MWVASLLQRPLLAASPGAGVLQVGSAGHGRKGEAPESQGSWAADVVSSDLTSHRIQAPLGSS